MRMEPERPAQSKVSRATTVVVRTLFVTLVFTLLGMGLGLFAGIIAMVVVAFLKNVYPDMQVAYLKIALPTAAVFGLTALVYKMVQEVRRAARAK